MAPDITILGGGVAGLAAGYFAVKKGLETLIIEASGVIGGLCRTINLDGFRIDTGAHRFHDRLPEVTREVKRLLGDDLLDVDAPNQIHLDGRLLDFPLSPLDVVIKMGPLLTLRAAAEVLAPGWREEGRGRPEGAAGDPRGEEEDFESFAVRSYGRTISERLLLNYSRKLWGLPCKALSSEIAGARLKGLDLNTFLRGLFRRGNESSRHLDGRFYYPREGIGMITDRLAGEIIAGGGGEIRLGSRVSRIVSDSRRIREIVVNDSDIIPVENLVSSIPLDIFVRALDPPPPEEIVELAGRLRYRSIILVFLLFEGDSLSPSASVHFPDPSVPFTRIFEPKNRSAEMAPVGKTSLGIEFPVTEGDETWRAPDEDIVMTAARHLARLGFRRKEDIVGSAVFRLSRAYPVIERESRSTVRRIMDHLATVGNLRIIGRNGRFEYRHIHDMIRHGRDLAADLAGKK